MGSGTNELAASVASRLSGISSLPRARLIAISQTVAALTYTRADSVIVRRVFFDKRPLAPSHHNRTCVSNKIFPARIFTAARREMQPRWIQAGDRIHA